MESGYVDIEDNIFPTLLAISEKEQEKGLMYQEWEPPVMSFIYPNPKISYFWMKNTPSPLDIVFCYKGKIEQIHKGEPHSTSLIGKNMLSDFVIEFPYGTMKKLGIQIGGKVNLIKPTSSELKKICALKYNIFIKR